MKKKSFLLVSICFLSSIYSVQKYIQDRDLFRIVKPYLPEAPIILEAGAFDGESTKKMKQFWPNATIYTFEPVPELFQKVVKKVGKLKNVFCFEYALSDSTGFSTFHISEDSHKPNEPFQSGSLLAPKEHLNYASWVLFTRDIQVPTITIDDWATKYNVNVVDFLYLDMQGNEIKALKSGLKILKTAKVVLVEYCTVEAYEGQELYDGVKTFFEENGFELIALNDNYVWFGDMLFVKK